MAYRTTHTVQATPASALVFGDALPMPPAPAAESAPPVHAFDSGDAGQSTLHLARLKAHAGRGYDLGKGNCVLRWAKVPAGYSGPVDVAVHFHGYVGAVKSMRLADKAKTSGIDLGAVARPTLGLVPHGLAHEWRYKVTLKDGTQEWRSGDGFTFPAIDDKAELDAFVAEALAAWAAQPGAGKLTLARLVLNGHSGGGAALSKLMQSVGTGEGVHGFHFFDATYGGKDVLTAAGGWAASAMQRDADALAKLSGDSARRDYLRSKGSALRIAFINGTGTAQVGKDTQDFLQQRLAALADAGVRALLAPRWRAQKVADPKKHGHSDVPGLCGGRLLADAADDLAPGMQDLASAATAPAAKAHALADPWDDNAYRAAALQAWRSEAGAEGADIAEQADALDTITMPVLVTRERAAGAPTGSAFINSLGNTTGVERENRIFEQLRAGNMPPSLLTFHTVRTTATDRAGASHRIEYYVTPDVLSIGTESDAVRVPMDPVTAQRVADAFDCLLPTARMVEQIYAAAPTKLEFIAGNFAGTPRAYLQAASSSYQEHSRAIDAQLRRPPTILTAGHKKELVISSNYRQQGQHDSHPVPKLAFYGAFKANGEPWQRGAGPRGMPSFAHEPSYVDYSHGVRLVWPTMQVDGSERRVADVLADANLAPLLAAEGAIANPRYTPTRTGAASAANAQSEWSLGDDHPSHTDADNDADNDGDPFGLHSGAGLGQSLGYGNTWDDRIRNTVAGLLARYRAIALTVGGQPLHVHPPYFINVNPKSAKASKDRFELAERHRAAGPAALRALINEKRFLMARIGKATPEALIDFLQSADAAGLLTTDATVPPPATPDKLRAFLKHYGIGVDCSGFVGLALNAVMDTLPGVAAADKLADPLGTASASFKGGQGAFERVTDPTQLCGGDTMWLEGHIRIVAQADRSGQRIFFCTAESRASDPADVGPAIRWWRCTPDASVKSGANFVGWQLERSNDRNAPDSDWQRVAQTHVYAHYRPLRRLLAAASVNPVALQSACVPAPRTADTSDLTQADVDTLAAIRFSNAADIESFFSRCGQPGFIGWYNAGLAHSIPFKERKQISNKQPVLDRFKSFWDQMATAYDQSDISALEFATMSAISINETGGDLAAFPEQGGKGRTGDDGVAHPGLAYFFDRIRSGTLRKASYNIMSGAPQRTAGSLFDDAAYIAAHGSLGGAARLAHHGSEFGGAWNGTLYPQADFGTDEDESVNGFIMQADFHKFRGRGVMQTTGRESYLRLVRWIQGYGGSNSVLLKFKKAWKGMAADVAATRSTDADWTLIFQQSETLARGLALHAQHADYRLMSTVAADLLHVPAATKKVPNPLGELGSIYAMGRRISGSSTYGSGRYRRRVLALLHGMLAL